MFPGQTGKPPAEPQVHSIYIVLNATFMAVFHKKNLNTCEMQERWSFFQSCCRPLLSERGTDSEHQTFNLMLTKDP